MCSEAAVLILQTVTHVCYVLSGLFHKHKKVLRHCVCSVECLVITVAVVHKVFRIAISAINSAVISSVRV
jgi:hypothetical protein